MMAIVPASDTGQHDIVAIARACVSRLSLHTQRAYMSHMTAYLQFALARGHPDNLLTREWISAYLDARKRAVGRPDANGATRKCGPVTLNIALAALKLLSREVWIRGLMPGDCYNAIADIRSEKKQGRRLGQWTNEQGVERLLDACMDLRERALIAVMCGCGLRRAEVAGLRWDQYQERAGRKVLLDIEGKGNRIRTVAVPIWASELIDEYQAECNEKEN